MSTISQLSGIVSLTSGTIPKDTAKIKESSQQFEALLIGQILRSAHSSDSGWLGGGDSSDACATDFAEEQMANTIAQNGGFGLAKMIQKGLEARS